MRASMDRTSNPSALRGSTWRRALLAVIWVVVVAGCATRPRPSVNADADAAAATPHQTPAPSVEPLSTAGPGGDVAFEEDQLPSAPEDIAASPIDGVVGEPVEVEELPDQEFAAAAADSGGADRLPPSVVVPVPASVQTPIPGSRPRMLLGFRVQIHAGESRGEAEQLANEAQTRLQVPAYTTFESPFYKVRLGDFLDRAEALALRERVRGYGYPGAWVVTTPVLADAAAQAATRAP